MVRMIIAGATLTLAACSGGSDIDARFAEFCDTNEIFKGSEPCTDPDALSDEQKEELMTRAAELDRGLDKMQESFDEALEAERARVEEAN
ncbi:MAG: hypothetical protein HKO13_02650 [Sphingomonas sp.]|nr:hypothetical protein [Sphingomonas sp.]